jgi:hypothetical protein
MVNSLVAIKFKMWHHRTLNPAAAPLSPTPPSPDLHSTHNLQLALKLPVLLQA